jgi:hypothetical protein
MGKHQPGIGYTDDEGRLHWCAACQYEGEHMGYQPVTTPPYSVPPGQEELTYQDLGKLPHNTPTYGMWETEPLPISPYTGEEYDPSWASLGSSYPYRRVDGDNLNARTLWGWLMFMLSGLVSKPAIKEDDHVWEDQDAMDGVQVGEVLPSYDMA